MPANISPSERYLHRAIAEILRAELAIHGLTIPTLSSLSGLPEQSVRRTLKGQRPIGLIEAIALCNHLELTAAQLIARATERAVRAMEEDASLARAIDDGVDRNF